MDLEAIADISERAVEAATVAEGALGGLLGYRLKRAYMRLHPAAQAALADLGIRVLPFSALCVIVENQGISLTEVGQALKIEKPNVGGIIDTLTRDGLITRAPSKTDRRRAVLIATARGRDLQARAVAAIMRSEDRLLARLDPSERQTLVRLLHKIGDAPD